MENDDQSGELGVTRSEGRGSELARRDIFDLAKDFGMAVASLLGKWCEVVIHDTSDLEHSIIWVQGDITGRRVGGMLSDVGLEMLHRGEAGPLFIYTTQTEDGKTLKSASMWLRDSDGKICGALCLNLDVTPILLLHEFAGELAPEESLAMSEHHVTDLSDLIDILVAQCEHQMSTPATEMSKDHRIEVVRILDERGAFQVRNSVVEVANRLGVTRKTIYNYLREIEEERETPTVETVVPAWTAPG
jgi:predicted transcriptional regulator YheO